MSQAITSPVAELRVQIKLTINQRLFEKGYIGEELYTRAKTVILTSR